MTLRTNARLAGATLLLYIATGITSMVLGARASAGEDVAARLASIAEHATMMRVNIVLTLLQAGYALVLAVTLFALTRDQDRDLAIMAMSCRLAEAVINAISPMKALGLLWIASGGAGADAAATDPAASNALAGLLMRVGGWTGTISATCFAVGSTLFCYLFLRARSIPLVLAWLGVAASILLVVLLPAQLAGFVAGPVTDFMWLPMLLFEVALALWLIAKGVTTRRSSP